MGNRDSFVVERVLDRREDRAHVRRYRHDVASTPEAVEGIADAVEPETLDMNYPDAVGAIINQHGFNLFWIGAVTLVCAYFIWRRSLVAAGLAALVGGLADVGYFVFLDLGGHVEFVPGTVMTIFSATAIVLTGWVWWTERRDHGRVQ